MDSQEESMSKTLEHNLLCPPSLSPPPRQAVSPAKFPLKLQRQNSIPENQSLLSCLQTHDVLNAAKNE